MAAELATATLLLGVAIAAAVCYVLDYLHVPKHQANEPPLVRHSIPYVGNIIGLLRYGTRYLQMTSAKCKLPIYSLNMLNGKVYVVTSPELVNAVNRNSKALAFNPFIAQLGKRITGHDEATGQIVQHNLNGEHGSGYVMDVHDGTVAALAPGRPMEDMTETMLREAAVFLEALEKNDTLELFAWTRRTMTMCSTRAIYGPENPFNKNADLVDAFWDFDRDLNILMLDIAPSILASRGHRARSELTAAFQEYFEHFRPEHTPSSAMTKARYAANHQHDLTLCNQARLEVGALIGILANTVPALFYMLVRVYSDPTLLHDIRCELEATAVSVGPGRAARSLQILTMRTKCHLLHATFQELLRVHALGASARFVREDVLLDDRYLLKKGMALLMPMAVMHADVSAWGADARRFQPRRFLKRQDEGSTPKEFKPNPATYRPFGGGASLCPGRHFVTLEIMALTAWMVLRFDLQPIDGRWSVPEQKQESLATNVFPPARDVTVKVTRRCGYEAVDWDFVMS